MPQMMPINWLIMFMFFSSLLMLFSLLNFYLLSTCPSSSKQIKPSLTSFTWKW